MMKLLLVIRDLSRRQSMILFKSMPSGASYCVPPAPDRNTSEILLAVARCEKTDQLVFGLDMSRGISWGGSSGGFCSGFAFCSGADFGAAGFDSRDRNL